MHGIWVRRLAAIGVAATGRPSRFLTIGNYVGRLTTLVRFTRVDSVGRQQ
jgi:hypothetical protein